MYQGFSVTAIDVLSNEGIVLVTTSFDIDPASVNESTIRLYSKSEKADLILDFEVNNKTIKIIPKNDIVQNSDYTLRIAGLKNILDEDLTSGVRRSIKFDTAIKAIPSIISPANHEELVDLKVTLKAMLEDKEYEAMEDKTYFIQIADDVAFINVILETKTSKEITDLKNLPAGQYYIRARIEDNNSEIGQWSETATFISINTETNHDTDIDDDEPVFIQDLCLVTIPANGETPDSIMIEFSGEIDPDSIENILVIRRDI